MAKASSFTLRVLMPIAAAATSSSRIAIQARPMRESSSRSEMKIDRERAGEEHEVIAVHRREA